MKHRHEQRDNSPSIIKYCHLQTIRTSIMKKMILSFLLFASALTAKSQLEKNTWLVGGSAYFYLSKRDYTSSVTSNGNGYSKELNLTMSPNIGYFLIDKLAVGVRPYFSWGKGEFFPSDPTSSGGSSDSKRYGIGPIARYYFLDKEKQFNILTDISYQFGEWNAGGQKGKLSNFSFTAGPVIYFNSSIGLEFLLGYNSQSEVLKAYSKNSSKGFQTSIGFQIHLIK